MAPYNRYLYVGFILLGVYFLVTQKNTADSLSFFGIALAFDPFDPKQPWGQRPVWQRLVLILHLFLVFGLLMTVFF